jgi:hypothetical protein
MDCTVICYFVIVRQDKIDAALTIADIVAKQRIVRGIEKQNAGLAISGAVILYP